MGNTTRIRLKDEFITVNGDKCVIRSTVAVPFELKGKIFVLDVLVMSQLSHILVLELIFG